ncbi:MAG: hypothetical protein K8T25_10460 [Planctomycetia bacterium]|nr:hypothetical protein [Planctomycetia bacterium]
MDFEVQRCSRHCATSGRELAPDEEFYSTLAAEGSAVVRHDYALDAWHGPPEGVLGWWKSRMPGRTTRRVNWAPSDVMLEYFEELAARPDKQDARYLLALLLIRRRVFRLEETREDTAGHETLVLYCPRRETSFEATVVQPDETRTREIQEELAALLVSGS